MNLERICSIRKLQPLLQLNRDYLPKNDHHFFKEQNDEKFEKKDAFGQIFLNSPSHRTVLQKDKRKNSLLRDR